MTRGDFCPEYQGIATGSAARVSWLREKTRDTLRVLPSREISLHLVRSATGCLARSSNEQRFLLSV